MRLMKEKLKSFCAPVYGRKAQLWKRLQEHAAITLRDEDIRAAWHQREQELQENDGKFSAPVVMPGVAAPSEEERALHALTHIPMKTWCEFCQRGKANDLPHRSVQPADRAAELPGLALDFGFANTRGEICDKQTADLFGTILFVVDTTTGYPLAIHTPQKGGSSQKYLVDKVCDFCDFLNLRTLQLRHDSEPAMLDLCRKIKAKRDKSNKTTHLEPTPRYSSASNGRAERTIQTVRKQMVTLRLALEAELKVVITANSPVYAWLARHAAWLIARFAIKLNGRSAYTEVFDSVYRSELLPFGETVLLCEKQRRLPLGQRPLVRTTGRKQ